MKGRSSIKDVFKNISAKKPNGKKQKIPAAIREAVWIKSCGRVFEHKCFTSWCPNTITVFDFQCGHNIPESKGGTIAVTNLYPLCSRCNLSMGDRYTIDEWNAITPPDKPHTWYTWRRFFSCMSILKVEKPPAPLQPASPSKPSSQ